jgi:hypothetical protein
MNNKQEICNYIMDVTTIEIIFDNRVTTVIDMKKNCQKSFHEVANQN